MVFGVYTEEIIAARGKGEIQKNEFYLYSKKKGMVKRKNSMRVKVYFKTTSVS